jgi:ankyrin repeat protein
MKTHGRKRYTLLVSGLVIGGLSLACFLWVRAEQRQYALNRQLIEAMQVGDVNEALALVEAGADPNTHITPTPTPTLPSLLGQMLHRSPPVNNSSTAFISLCGDIWELDSDSPLRQRNDLQLPVLQAMLDHGADIDARDGQNAIGHHRTALIWASNWGFTDRMTLLLEHGASVDLQDDNGKTALICALRYPEAVKLLLKYHADPNVRDSYSHTALYNLQKLPDGISPEAIQTVSQLLKQAGATE